MMSEMPENPDRQWRVIAGYRGYCVSDDGYVQNDHGKALSQKLDKNGYLVARIIRNDGTRGCPYTHKLVTLAFLGKPPEGCSVDHINGDRTDNRLSNLEYVTTGENTRRSFQNGDGQTTTQESSMRDKK